MVDSQFLMIGPSVAASSDERSPSCGSIRSDWSEEALRAKASDAKAQKAWKSWAW
jgi:hypothetical protein